MGRSVVNRGLGDAPCFAKPSGSSPYYEFGAQRRYPYAWHGRAGGVPTSRVAAESRGLGEVSGGTIVGIGVAGMLLVIAVPIVATVMIARSIKKSERRGR